MYELTDERLAELRRIAEGADSPGPWEARRAAHFEDDCPVYDAGGLPLCVSPDDGVRGGHSDADAKHIAAFDPPTALALLDAVRERNGYRESLAARGGGE